MKKRFDTKRVILVSLFIGTMGSIVAACVFMKTMGGELPDILWVRQRELQYCPRCGMERWEQTRGFLFGLRTHGIEEKQVQAAKIPGVDRANCNHLFFTVAEDGKMLVTRGFKMQKFKIGNPTGDTCWDAPVLVEAFRAMEKENQGQAFTLFQFLVNERQRGAGMSNVVEALKGTNSQAVVEAMYQIYTNGGMRRLPGSAKVRE
jgi:hypothetical protein